LTAIISSKSSMDTSSRLCRFPDPAAATSTSTAPSCDSTASTSSSGASGRRRFAAIATASPPPSTISAANFSAGSECSPYPSATAAPSAARPRAIA